jgi:hypothetical protein
MRSASTALADGPHTTIGTTFHPAAGIASLLRRSAAAALCALFIAAAFAAPAGAVAATPQPAEFAVYQRPPDFQMYETEQLRQSCINHGLPPDCGGEPSIGVNPFTNNAMVQMMLTTARIGWDDSRQPPAATWTNVSYTGFVTTGDPVGTVDRATGRAFDVQLLRGRVGVATSDDDGATWNDASSVFIADPDKPVIGAGPYHGSAPAGASFPSAVHVCVSHWPPSQNGNCFRSDDGGATWGSPSVVPTAIAGCLAFAGAIHVDADGVVYLPLAHCGSAQGVAISDDNGQTWRVMRIRGVRDGDQTYDQFPDVASDRGGRVYYAASSRGRPVVSATDDHGGHWSAPVDIAAGTPIASAEFPTIVAGDHGRAALAFLGSTTRGYPENASYDGVWRLYVVITLDGGQTWSTPTDVTRDDPVQRGCIGAKFVGSCKRRNLLDFMDSAIDAEGRVLVAYPDGCVTDTCVAPGGTQADSNDSSYAVARQIAGPRMVAAFDPR